MERGRSTEHELTDWARLEGVYAPIPTPFTLGGKVDVDALRRNLARWAGSQLSGYVALGSTGEAPLLTEAECVTVVREVRACGLRGRVLLAGAGRQSTVATQHAVEAVADAGADAALVLTPSYYRAVTSEDALIEHFAAVAASAPIPVIIYNMPACTGVDLSAAAVIRMSRAENIAGIKDSGGDLAKLAAICAAVGDTFSVLAGSAGFFVPALAAGVSGGILALANVAPEACLGMWRAASDEAWDDARQQQARLVELNTAVTRRWGVPGLKAAMDLIGLDGGAPRPPLKPLRGDALTELRRMLDCVVGLPEQEER